MIVYVYVIIVIVYNRNIDMLIFDILVAVAPVSGYISQLKLIK